MPHRTPGSPPLPASALPPVDEDTRLEALAEYGWLDTPAEEALDRVTRLAARIFDTPTALVSLVDRNRQFFKARLGFALPETPRDLSFCAHGLGTAALLIVPDARADPRFAGNPLVVQAPGVRFYAGAPLISPTGRSLGSLCVIDTHPHPALSAVQEATLRDLAALVMDQFESRRLGRAHHAGIAHFQRIAAVSPDAVVCTDAFGILTFWNPAAQALFGIAAREALGRNVTTLMPASSVGSYREGMRLAADGAGRAGRIGTSVQLAGVHRNGQRMLLEATVSGWPEHAGMAKAAYGIRFRDLAQRREVEARLYRLARLDCLTGMANREAFTAQLATLVDARTPLDLCLIDLDNFKIINETWGHAAGDRVLETLAARIRATLGDGAAGPPSGGARHADGFLGRLGGTAFGAILPGNGSQAELSAVCRRLGAILAEPVELDGQRVSVGACLGVASYPADADDSRDLLGNADLALHQAKGEGPTTHRFFVPALRDAAVERRSLEQELHDALDAGQLELFYQPQVDLATRRILGAEALLRWRHPARGLLGPPDFIEMLESSSLAAVVGERILEVACAQAARWRRAGFADFQMSINLFGRQVVSGQLFASVMQPIRRHGLPPSAVEIEITETTILRRDDVILEPLRALCRAGVRIAFDDYGTGYASLSLLKNFPLTRLKIDKSFVTNLVADPKDGAVIQAIIFLARNFDLRVIAEGVETAEQAAALLRWGCLEAQGFLFGQAVPAAQFEAALFPAGLADAPLASVL